VGSAVVCSEGLTKTPHVMCVIAEARSALSPQSELAVCGSSLSRDGGPEIQSHVAGIPIR